MSLIKGLYKKVYVFLELVIVKPIQYVLNILLNPLFYISAILIAFVINTFFTPCTSEIISANLPEIIKYLIQDRMYSTLILVCWGIFSFLKLSYDEKLIEIQKKDNEIESLHEQIKHSSGIIEARYGEFANIINEQNIYSILEKSINKFPILEAAHLYNYTFQKVKTSIEIKINFFIGCEQELVRINVIKQQYYNIEKNIFLKFLKINRRLNDTKFDAVKEMTTLKDDIDKSHMDKTMKEKLTEIIIVLLLKKLGRRDSGLAERNNEAAPKIKNAMVTPIILNEGYIYQYAGDDINKSGRMYFSSQINLDNDYILTLVLDGSDFKFDEIEEYFKNVTKYIKDSYRNLLGDNNYEEG